MEVLLDTNFVLSCIKKKIDFISDLEGMGFKVLLPKEVFQEIKDLTLHSNYETRIASNVALELLKKRKVKGVTIGNKQVDEGLIEFGRKGAYIATLDAAIKRAVPNKVVISEQSNSVIVERD